MIENFASDVHLEFIVIYTDLYICDTQKYHLKKLCEEYWNLNQSFLSVGNFKLIIQFMLDVCFT